MSLFKVISLPNNFESFTFFFSFARKGNGPNSLALSQRHGDGEVAGAVEVWGPRAWKTGLWRSQGRIYMKSSLSHVYRELGKN